ncbi:MAG TPA: DUF2868 domain-containing protein [Opitutus sp.]|nr:DUF2868 domain-containing protein [Opitutus sp.]
MVPAMPKRRRRQPEIADIVALAHALDHDSQRSAGDLAEREKRFAPGLPTNTEDPLTLGLAWLEAVEGEDDTVRILHQRADTALHLTGFFIVLAGVLLGAAATLGAFYFDGSGRVNAVSVLALLVAVPALFILPFAIAALPARIAERVPGVGLITALAGALSPGRLVPFVWRMFPRDLRESMALISGRLSKHHRLYADLKKWVILRWSQLFAVSFQVTALLVCLMLVVFTDLAFGWSTTLTTGDALRDAQRIHGITSIMAAPWSWALVDAQPSLALIEESRYFRAAAEPLSFAQAARLGGWWKFVVLTIAVYGLLPRLLTLAVANSQLRAAARAAVIAGPGLSAVLRRIHRARIQSAAIEPESPETRGQSGHQASDPSPLAPNHIEAVINWAGVPVEAGVLTKLIPGARIFQAGGATSLSDDVALAKRIGALNLSSDAAVLIVVKAWEPPLMEFLDFLTALRIALSPSSAMIIVLPVGLSGDRDLPAATTSQFKLWSDKLAALGDPWLRVASSRQEVLA